MRTLSDDRSIVIKKADKGSCFVVWSRWNHIKKVEKQLGKVLFMTKSITLKRFFRSWLTQAINTSRNLTIVVTFVMKK